MISSGMLLEREALRFLRDERGLLPVWALGIVTVLSLALFVTN